jgi:hypothetical protein
MSAKKQEVITVVAELSVEHSGEKIVVRSYDSAWQLSHEWATQGLLPVKQTFLGFVRKDKDE